MIERLSRMDAAESDSKHVHDGACYEPGSYLRVGMIYCDIMF